MPQEAPKRLVPAGMKRTQEPIPEAAPLTPKVAPMTVSGFLEHVGRGAKNVVTGTVDALTEAAKATAYITKNAEMLGEISPEYLAQDYKNVGKALVHAIVDKYEKHGLRALYEEPVDVAGDIATVLSAGGGAAAKAGKLTGLKGLENAGKAVAAVPGKVGQMVAEAPLRLLKINPELRKKLTTYDREELSIGEIRKKKIGDALEKRFAGLTDEDKVLLDKLAVEGGAAADLATNPKVARALSGYQAVVKFIRERQLGEKGRNLLSAGDMEGAVIKKLANRKGISADEAADLYSKLEVKPIYTPAIRDGKELGIWDLIHGPESVRTGGVGFLERFKGGKFSQDPVKYMKKAVNDFIDTETRLRFMDRVIGDPALTKGVQAGESALGQVVPEGIFKKYFEDKSRSQRIAARDQFIKGAEEGLLSDPVTQKYVRSIAAIGATDPTVANYLKRTFEEWPRLRAYLRVYDKIINTFKLTATTLNPRYYSGNLVGDGILSVMAGEYGLHWGMAKKIMNSLPPELRAGMRATLSDNPLLNKFQKLSQIAQSADDLARAGIWTKEVAKKFKDTGSTFATAEQAFEDFARQIGESVQDLSNLEVKAQIAGEHLVRSSSALYSAKKKLDALDNAHINAQNKLNQARMEGRATEKLQAKVVKLGDALYDIRNDYDALMGKARQQMVQSGEYHRRIQEAAKYAEVARQATDRANTFLGDYLGLGPIERAVFRRVVPFYAFTKAMTKLAFTYPFIAPKTSFFWHRYSQALADMSTDPDMPDWMAGYFPVGGDEKGDTYWIRLSQLGPFGGVKTGRAGDMPIPSILQFWQQNPLIRLGYRTIGGRDEFYWAGRPKAGDTWVQAGEGKITRFRPDGTLETVVPQMSLIEGLETMFPVVQTMNQLIQDYDVMKGNAQKPDGSPKFPVTGTDKVLRTMGVSTKTGEPSDFRRGEKYGVRKTIEDLKKAYPRMDPQQREEAREYMRDFSRGHYRKFRSAQ